jgi:Acyl-CoA synthetases (AMP-forming)/AMP-acid ligases II
MLRPNQDEQILLLEGRPYSRSAVERQALQCCGLDDFQGDLWRFLAEWFDENDSVPGLSSGSTGAPKVMRLEKERMRHSARLTCSFLGLGPGDAALLCMPLKYVGAKMMVVRALVAGLNLICVPPSSRPLRECPLIPAFAAMTPMQVLSTLEQPEEAARLRRIGHLIIGGGAVEASLSEQLRDFPNAVWSTYGMTETLSHIALRRLSGPEASDWYRPFEGVSLSASPEGSLVIDAPGLCAEQLVTNDLVEFGSEACFRILGRKDNVINSGGVKVQIETAEELLRPHLGGAFLITSGPDSKTGEQVVLLTEGECPEELLATCKSVLPPYWAPVRALRVKSLPLTGSGKPNRAAAKLMARELLDSASRTGKG